MPLIGDLFGGVSEPDPYDYNAHRLLAAQRLRVLLAMGDYSPDKEGRKKFTAEAGPAPESAAEKYTPGVISFLETAPNAVAGLEAGGLSSAAAAPFLGPAAPLVGIPVGLLTGLGLAHASKKVTEAVRPGSIEDIAKAAEEHPYVYKAGEAAGALAGLKPNLRTVGSLGQRGIGALTGAGAAGAGALVQGRAPTWQELAEGGAFGFATEPYERFTSYEGLTKGSAKKAATSAYEKLAKKQEGDLIEAYKRGQRKAQDVGPLPVVRSTPFEAAIKKAFPAIDETEIASIAAKLRAKTMDPEVDAEPIIAGMLTRRGIDPYAAGMDEGGGIGHEGAAHQAIAEGTQSIAELVRRGFLPKYDPLSLNAGPGFTFDPRAAEMRAELIRRGARNSKEAARIIMEGDPSLSRPIAENVAAQIFARGIHEGADPVRLAQLEELAHKRHATRADTLATERMAKQPDVPAPPSPSAGKLTAALKQANVDRAAQERLYTQELAARFGAMKQQLNKGAGEAETRAALGTLKGELPKVEFTGVREQLTEADVADLMRQADQHPSVAGDDLARLNARTSLMQLLDPRGGRVPQPAQIEALEKIFGSDLATELLKKRGVSPWSYVARAANLPRAMIAGYDLSYDLWQAAPLMALRPKGTPAALKAQAKALFSPEASAAIEETLLADPYAKQHIENGGFFSEAHERVSQKASKLEEHYQGARDVERVLNAIPGVGKYARRFYKATERANLAYLNKFRLDTYKALAQELEAQGMSPKSHPLEYKALSTLINRASGRGDLGVLERVTPVLNAVFFSPRLAASRLQLLNPVYYAKMPKPVRVQAWRMVRNSIGATLAAQALYKMAGAKVEEDPRSTNWGKGRFGQARLDTMAGFQQTGRFLAQVVTGQKKTESGAMMPANRLETIGRMVRSKMSPAAGVVTDMLSGHNMLGEQRDLVKMARGVIDDMVGLKLTSASKEARNMLAENIAPMWMQDSYDAGKASGPVSGIGGGLWAFAGGGIQTYGSPIPDEAMVKTPAENLMVNLAAKHVGERTPEEKETQKEKLAIEARLRKGENISQQLGEALHSGVINPGQAMSMFKRAGLDYWSTRFKGLGLDEAEKVFAQARPGEQAKWRRILDEKRAAVRARDLTNERSLFTKHGVGAPPSLDETRELAQLKVQLRQIKAQRMAAEKARGMALGSLPDAGNP